MIAEKKLIQYFYNLYKNDCITLNCPPDKTNCSFKDKPGRCEKCWKGFIKERYKEFFKEEDIVEKPPAGVVPEYIHKQRRMEALSKAINAHIQTGCIGGGYAEELEMWITELHQLLGWVILKERSKLNG